MKKPNLRKQIEGLLAESRGSSRRDLEDDDDVTSAKVVGAEDSDSGEEAAGAFDFSFAEERTKLRMRADQRAADSDPRYRGKKVSRRNLNDEGDNGSELAADEKEHAQAELSYMFERDDEEEEEEVDQDSDENEDYDESDENEEELSDEEKTDVEAFASSNLDSEIQKGKSIAFQMALWESMLECRIQMQKIMTKLNQFPQPSEWDNFASKGDEQYLAATKKSESSIRSILDQVLKLQETALGSINSIDLANGKRSSSEDEENDEGAASPKKMRLAEYSTVLAERHDALRPFLNSTIEKWNDRTRLASGVVKSKTFNAFETSTLKQIEQVLSDKPRLIRRTQLKRSQYRVLGRPEAAQQSDASGGLEQDEEIYDDDDFYHQLLRELIDRKAGDITDPIELGRHWLQIQKMRSKIKRKVDTKASKGRKMRYDIHAKLVNFMAPVYKTTWKDDARNELYSSLFGKGKERSARA